MSEKLRYHAEHEALTKLSNRSLFHKQLQQEINAARKKSHSFALCVLGLDRFRELNHTFGPLAGDLLLREVGRRFASATGNCRARAWLGGAEFAALFPASVETGIGVVCTDILSMLATPFLAQDVPVDLSGSIGVAFFPKHGEQANLLLQRASIALDRAKDAGHDYAFYEPENDPYSQRKLAYLSGIRIAIEQNQLILHYQPKIDMKTKRTCGIEALVRWNHPQIGLVPPVEFVSIAERTGLIHTLSRWVLRAALEQCRAWHCAGLDIPVAVNLSPRNFHDHQLPDYIAALLRECRLSPACLELEITETVMMADAPHVSEALSRLSQMGVRTFIDDFGTGYSSLGHLKKLPVAGIKIDKSFVSKMTYDENDTVIVHSTIDLGHNLGLEVVAEGVESPEIWNRLSLLGCNSAQGYYMSRPKPATELERWFAESPWGINKSAGTTGRRR
ncbi:MAG TPA: bifunctional diguanylate cyclase/phosphodiesterase [Thermoguttaceae bacterium]